MISDQVSTNEIYIPLPFTVYIFWPCAISFFAKFCSLFGEIDKIESSAIQTDCFFEVTIDDNKIKL